MAILATPEMQKYYGALASIGDLIQTAFDNEKEFIHEMCKSISIHPDGVFELGNIFVSERLAFVTWTDYNGEYNQEYLHIDVLVDFHLRYGKRAISTMFSG